MVTVYTTTISEPTQRDQLINSLSSEFPALPVSMDLSDPMPQPYPCGHSVLRIAGNGVDPEDIVARVRAAGFQCDVLEDRVCTRAKGNAFLYGWL